MNKKLIAMLSALSLSVTEQLVQKMKIIHITK